MAPPGGSGQKKSFDQAAIGGGIAGGIELTIMFPTEFIKTQLQLQNKQNPKYKGMIDCAILTVRENGPFGLYRGLGSLLAGSIPKAAVRFASFEFFAGKLMDKDGKMSASKNFLAGLCAGLIEAVTVVTPLETVKTKFIHDQNSPKDQRKYKGTVHGVSAIIKQEGLSGIYKGLVPTMMKQSTNQATRFLVFGEMRKYFQGGDSKKQLNVGESLISGALAGGASVLVNNPIDVVKTKMQGLEAKNYKGTVDCFKSILVNQGPTFFYRGCAPRLIRVMGDVAITFTVYERVVRIYDQLLHGK